MIIRKKIVIGQQFGKLTTLSETRLGPCTAWVCQCSCGRKKTIITGSLNAGRSKTCGYCSHNETNVKHGHNRGGGKFRTSEYGTWDSMKQRCYNKNNLRFYRYGGRGIIVCERWRNNFLNFITDMGRRPEGYLLDRIDNNGNYEPSNCRWATISTSNNNKTQRQPINLNVQAKHT